MHFATIAQLTNAEKLEETLEIQNESSTVRVTVSGLNLSFCQVNFSFRHFCQVSVRTKLLARFVSIHTSPKLQMNQSIKLERLTRLRAQLVSLFFIQKKQTIVVIFQDHRTDRFYLFQVFHINLKLLLMGLGIT